MTRGGFERFEYSKAGYIEIMKSGPVQGILSAKGEAIAASIRSRLDLEGWDVVVVNTVGRTRARTIVSGVPESIEQRQAILGSALDAGRG